MMRAIVSLSSILLLAACATPVSDIPETNPRLLMPVSVEAGIARIDLRAPCSQKQAYEVREVANPAPDRPQRVKTCIPEFPPVLLRNEYQAACLSSFLLTAEGVPTDIITSCATYRGLGYAQADSDVATAMFEHAMQRVIGEMRYAPESETSPRDPEKRYSQPLKFAFDGEARRLAYPNDIKIEVAE